MIFFLQAEPFDYNTLTPFVGAVAILSVGICNIAMAVRSHRHQKDLVRISGERFHQQQIDQQLQFESQIATQEEHHEKSLARQKTNFQMQLFDKRFAVVSCVMDAAFKVLSDSLKANQLEEMVHEIDKGGYLFDRETWEMMLQLRRLCDQHNTLNHLIKSGDAIDANDHSTSKKSVLQMSKDLESLTDKFLKNSEFKEPFN